MPLLEAKLSLKSRRHVTKSMEGQDKMERSDSKSLGPEERHTNHNVSAISDIPQQYTQCSLISSEETSVSIVLYGLDVAHQQQA